MISRRIITLIYAFSDLDLEDAASPDEPYLPNNFAAQITVLEPCSSTGGLLDCKFVPYGGAPAFDQYGVVTV